MARMNWNVSAEEIDNAEVRDFTPYDGPPLPAGSYVWEIKVLKVGESAAGNPKLRMLLVFPNVEKDPNWDEYVGAAVWNDVGVTSNSTGLVKPFLDAIGVSSVDFTTRTMVDEKQNVVKIGKVVPIGMLVRAYMGIESSAEYGEQRKIKGGWAPYGKAAKATARKAADPMTSAAPEAPAGDNDPDYEEPPF